MKALGVLTDDPCIVLPHILKTSNTYVFINFFFFSFRYEHFDIYTCWCAATGRVFDSINNKYTYFIHSGSMFF